MLVHNDTHPSQMWLPFQLLHIYGNDQSIDQSFWTGIYQQFMQRCYSVWPKFLQMLYKIPGKLCFPIILHRAEFPKFPEIRKFLVKSHLGYDSFKIHGKIVSYSACKHLSWTTLWPLHNSLGNKLENSGQPSYVVKAPTCHPSTCLSKPQLNRLQLVELSFQAVQHTIRWWPWNKKSR